MYSIRSDNSLTKFRLYNSVSVIYFMFKNFTRVQSLPVTVISGLNMQSGLLNPWMPETSQQVTLDYYRKRQPPVDFGLYLYYRSAVFRKLVEPAYV